MNPSNALFAFDGAHLLGMIGFQLDGQKFIDVSVQRIWKHNGLSSVWRLLLLGLLERKPVKHELLLDGICVAEQARGRGVGTALLEAAVQMALRHGCTQVRLDVVDSNPRARALYERFGFQATREVRTGWLTRPLGFGSSTTMVYRMPPDSAGLGPS
jgi:ribosomal protein S18 acetylase RimI-like enzyme